MPPDTFWIGLLPIIGFAVGFYCARRRVNALRAAMNKASDKNE